MKIISHRGYWKNFEENNRQISFNRSFEFGYGTETDIRDYQGELVVSHEIPNEFSMTMIKFLELYAGYKNPFLLALNIKADGLQRKMRELLEKYNITNYFLFDMSIPDTIQYIKMGFNVFCRQSEYELNVPFYNEIKGIWLDSFCKIWYSSDLVNEHLINGKQVCIVSSELHKRDHLNHWQYLKSFNLNNSDNLILCTDYPEEARKYFED